MPINPANWRKEFFNAEALPPTASSAQKARRGRAFEQILSAMFEEAGLRPRLSYRPVGEEIDGSIWFDGRTILIEAKWTEAPHPASSIYQFKGKVDGKLVGTLGLFISVNGFSPDAVDALVAGKELNIVLADGADIGAIARGEVSVVDALYQKFRAAGDEGAVYWPVEATETRAEERPAPTSPLVNRDSRRLVMVEGRSDARYLQAVRRVLGFTTPLTFIPAGGPRNMPNLISALSEGTDLNSVVAIVDADSAAFVERELRDMWVRRTGSIDVPRMRVIAVEPDLETVLGLADDVATLGARSPLRRMTDEELFYRLSQAGLAMRAQHEHSLKSILQAIAD